MLDLSHFSCPPPSTGSPCLLVAGEEGTVFALEELLATVAVPVVPAKALHVSGAELTELAGEDTVWSAVSRR